MLCVACLAVGVGLGVAYHLGYLDDVIRKAKGEAGPPKPASDIPQPPPLPDKF